MIINDDFESGAAGEVPPGWRTILGYGVVDSSASGSAAVLDSSRAHSGTRSVKITTSNAMAPHFIFQALPAGITKVFVRAWVYSPAQLGGGSAGGGGDHAHIIGTLQTPGSDDGQELRFGPVQRAYLGGFSPKPGDAFTKAQPTVVIPSNTWTCVEWAVEDAPNFDRMYAWIGDQPLFAAESVDDWQNTIDADFAKIIGYVSFGWRQFGSVANISNIWFDDIAVGNSRVGCN